MVFEHKDYRSVLKSAIATKSKNQKSLSLRSFAKRLGLSTSFLSEVLNGKKLLSVDLAFKIAIKLQLTDTEIQYFCLLVQIEQEKDASFRKELIQRLKELRPNKRKSYELSMDRFKSISEWQHAAILELTYLPIRLTPESVSKLLGISKIEAELSLSRLFRLDLIEKNTDGTFRKTHNHVYTQSPIPNEAIKQFHEQILKKASSSLQTTTPSERMSATDIVPIDSKHLPYIDRLSQEFSSEVLKLSERSTLKDSVYALSVHFFPLTLKDKGEMQ